MKINKNIVRATGFMLGLFALLFLMSAEYRKRSNIHVYDANAVSGKEAELALETENSIDVLFCGDSVCYSSFSPLRLFSEFGCTSYVCATSAQRLCDTYAILENAFTSQSPKVVVLETSCLYRSMSSDSGAQDSVMRFLTDRVYVFAHHSDWKAVVGAFLPNIAYIKQGDEKGFVVRNSVNPYTGGSYMVETEETKCFPEESSDCLEQILRLCEDNHAKLLLVSAPSPQNWCYEKHNGVKQWARQHGVDYIDLNLESSIGIDWETDTKDGGDHLNLTGARKVTSFIGRYLVEEYALPDLRNNPEYKDWEECCAAFGIEYSGIE